MIKSSALANILKKKLRLSFVFYFSFIALAFAIIPQAASAADTWAAQTGSGAREWTSVVVSSDGAKMAAVSPQGYVYTSTDGGITWTARTTSGLRNWQKITSSADGVKLAAIPVYGYIYTSADSGATWTQRNGAGSKNWESITSSINGDKLVVGSSNGSIWTSVNGGANWTERAGAGSFEWSSISSSDDGVNLIATNGTNIFTSTSSGVTWVSQAGAGSRSWKAVAASSDGTKLVATVSSGYIYTSIDSGLAWTERVTSGSNNWYSVSSSGDGTKLAAATEYGTIYLSTDSGATWVNQTNVGERYWSSVAFSSDGTKLAASAYYSDYIYVYGPDAIPQLVTNFFIPSAATSSIVLTGFANTGVTARGFEYGLTTSYGATTTQSGSSVIGSYSATLSLTPNTVYHYRAYATNSFGTGYGSDLTFKIIPLTRISRAGSRNFMGITSSADGTKLAAIELNGYIYTSTDSGATWVERTGAGARVWTAITSSADGNKLAVVDSGGSGGYVYTSINGGATWTERTGAGTGGWNSITSSDDGVNLAVVGPYSDVYTSTSSGATWVQRTGSGSYQWKAITSSADGTKLAAVVYNGYIYTSTSSGATWTQRTGAGVGSWNSITSSADGSKLIAGGWGSYLYASDDGGATWAPLINAGAPNWYGVTVSDDGTKIAAGVAYTSVYTSNDSGVSWTEQTSGGASSWRYITSSADGGMIAVTNNSYVYMSPAPQFPPVASSVAITGAPGVGSLLTGTYIYSDDNNDFEGASTFRWLRDDVAISNATSTTYTTVLADYETVIKFEVSPAALTGTATGTPVQSDGIGIAVATSSLATSPATSLTPSTAVLNGNITAVGLSNPTVRGFEYGLSESYGKTTVENGSFSAGTYSSSASALKCETIYHYRAYAINGSGTGYGDDQTFTTAGCWAQETDSGTRNWKSIISSEDGTKLAAVVYGGYIYTSINSGITWTENISLGFHNWESITSSADGNKLAVAVKNGYIYTSTDAGSTWAVRTGSGSHNWSSIVSSGDGTKLAATDNSGYIYTSDDSGVTWTVQTGSGARAWYSIASSIHGTKLAAVDNSGYIYTSTNSGVSWVERIGSGARNWYSITSSADGVKLAAVDNGGLIYTSDDSGATWTAQTSAGSYDWYSIASSADGSKLAAGVNSGYIYVSLDSGATWAEQTSAGVRIWKSITSSADGVDMTKLAAIDNAGYIYTYAPVTSPTITTKPASSVTPTAAALNATIIATGGENATVRGFEYGLDTSYGASTTESGLFGVGSFSANISSLVANAIYHYRAYATNYLGTSYGADMTFTIQPFALQINAGSRTWSSITSSANGAKLAATDSSGYIYTSTDSGTNWTERTAGGTHNWSSITSSDDGTKLAAVGDYVYTSTDSGATWTQRGATGVSITSSADGTKLAVAGAYSSIYTSTDSGANWTERTSTGSYQWKAITSSADGTKLAAVVYNGYIYTSDDSGATWTQRTGPGMNGWNSITSSADGSKIIAGGWGSYLYASSDSGATWVPLINAGGRQWYSLTSSDDGTKLAAGAAYTYIYTSADSGVTWTEQTSAGSNSWRSITSSADGTKIAVTNNTYIYTCNLVISVPTDSTNTITWTTSENSSSQVEYGLTASYGLTTPEINTSPRITNHLVSLSDLTSCTTYYYRVHSKNASDVEVFYADNTFTTSGCTASSPVRTSATEQISVESGGTLSLKDESSHGLTLTVPASFSSLDANFQAHKLDRTTVLDLTSRPSGYTSAGDYVYELKALTNASTTISSFDNPLTVTISYAQGDVSGLDESSLKIHRWDGAGWNELTGCVVNKPAKTITCATTHFSTFASFGRALAVSLQLAGGGGAPSDWGNKPIEPAGGFKVIINDGAASTADRIVNLSLNAGSDVQRMAISMIGNFSDSNLMTYNKSVQLDLCSKLGGLVKNPVCPDGVYNVYVQVYTQHGVASNVFSQSITLKSGVPAAAPLTVSSSSPIQIISLALSRRLSGRILLQVEAKGEAWYVNVTDISRYYLGRPADAFAIMRKMALGVSNKTWATFKNGKAPARLAGRILLKVEDSGRAYYVNPLDLKMYYLGRPADAFSVMRSLGLGITNSDLNKIKIGKLN